MYNWVSDKKLLKLMNMECSSIINEYKMLINKDGNLKVDIKLVGSGARNMILQNGKDPIDLDYNLMIQRDKVGITNDPKELKSAIMQAFRECLPRGTHVCDSTSAITVRSNNFVINGYRYSADFAIMFDDEFQKRLSDLRTQKGVSARDMSLSIGQNPNYINTIESGRAMPSMSVFLSICDYLKITPSEFFNTENSQPEKLRTAIKNLQKLIKIY